MRNPRIAWILTVVSVIVSVVAYPFLPELVPSHWNVQGEIDGMMGRLPTVLLLPAIIVVMVVLRDWLPKLDPRRENYAEFQGTYQLIINALVLFLLVLHVAILAVGLGVKVDVSTFVQVGIGLLLMVIGNELSRVQPNYFVGIRTPWTLTDPENWRRTHRMGGRVMVISGAAIALAGVLLPSFFAFVVTMLSVLAMVGGTIGYSYYVWRQAHAR